MSETGLSILPKKYRKSVERIYNDHKKLMYYIAMQFVKNVDHADDIVHSSFLRIIRHIEKIESFSPEVQKGYIVFIVKNLSIDFIRRSENTKTVPIEDFESYLASSQNETEKTAISNFEALKVIECIENLEQKYSFAVLHKYVLGYSTAEIAELLDITIENARVRCHRGRKMLLNAILEGDLNG